MLRMFAQPVNEEVHLHDEALVVLDSQLELVVRGESFSVRAGEFFTLRAGVPHAVAAGSWDTLLIVDPAA